jgi:hypothetical protein
MARNIFMRWFLRRYLPFLPLSVFCLRPSLSLFLFSSAHLSLSLSLSLYLTRKCVCLRGLSGKPLTLSWIEEAILPKGETGIKLVSYSAPEVCS